MTTPRFVAIVTPGKEKRFRVFDRVSKNSFAGTNDRELANRLASEFSKTYALTFRQRLLAWLLRRPIPMPPPDPVDEPEVPEWKRRLDAINNLVEDHKQRARLAGGGRIVDSDPVT